MSNLQEMLAQKAAQAALQKNPETGAAPPTEEELKRLADVEALTSAEAFVPPPGSYRALRLHQVILANGSVWKPTKGFYIPETEEHQKALDYYLSIGEGSLIEKVDTED